MITTTETDDMRAALASIAAGGTNGGGDTIALASETVLEMVARLVVELATT